ncbi:hypothetical protein ASF73_04485 [Xanthomonas sp. Leaf131]|nr:hypothetical protein ASF73_04485 [Xanthomonas sp. Leaf131]
MARIRATRDSINDRFNVLSFSVRSDNAPFEIGLATDPELLKPENRERRTSRTFFSSLVQTGSNGRDATYLVPPSVVARFVGQPRVYFGLATYSERDRARPVQVQMPDRGNMYINLSGLTERGLRRTARPQPTGSSNYAGEGAALAWGGDALATTGAAPARPATGNAGAAAGGYSDGYSDELWQHPADQAAAQSPAPVTPAPVAASTPPAAEPRTPASNGATSVATPVTAQGWAAPQASNARPTVRPARPAPAPAMQRSGTPAQAMRVVGQYDTPEDWRDALLAQLEFFASSARWVLGVPDTTVPPYSAICQVRRVDGNDEGIQHGTAFFIAPRLLLTAAHVVAGQSELIIVPGKQGAGVDHANEPFGRFHVAAADMLTHPAYSDTSYDFDMALIRVPEANAVAAPQFFDLVEELTQSRPEKTVVSGYAAFSPDTSLAGTVVNALIDPDRQHMHGGHLRELPSAETFSYDVQSLGGTSGSPVYYIDQGASPRAHMVGVHIAPFNDVSNLGCRITAGKLAWIRQQAADWNQTLSFSLRARALSEPSTEESASEDPDRFGITDDEPPGIANAGAQSLRSRALDTPAAEYPGASRFAAAHARNFRAGRRAGVALDRIVIHITAGGPSIDGTIGWFQNPDARVSAHYLVGRDGEVVQMVRNADTGYHASAANSRSIGIEHCANKPSRGNPRDLPVTEPQYAASAGLVAWLCQQLGLPADRAHIVGHQEISPGDNHACPSSIWDWDHYLACVQQALAGNAGAANSQPLSLQAGRGARTRALTIDTDDIAQAQRYAPQWADLFNWSAPAEVDSAVSARGMAIQRIQDAAGELSLDRYEVRCERLPEGWSAPALVEHLRLHLNDFIDTDYSTFIPYVAGVDDTTWQSASPLGAVFKIDIGGPDNAAVVASLVEPQRWRFTTVHTEWSGDHPVSGHRELGVRDDAGTPVFYTRGADRWTGGPGASIGFFAADRLWKSFQRKLSAWIQANGGAASVPAPFSERLHAEVVRILYPASAQSLSLPRNARALNSEPVYEVALIAQPDKRACWAAVMAMLLSYRRAAPVTPEALVAEVGASLSSSYGVEVLTAVSQRYGFTAIELPSNASLYHSPQQWADWLTAYGPLWVVIVGAPHAVVLSGISGNLADPASVVVHILNPWDTRVAFDNDPVTFIPPNQGYADWLSFEEFAEAFGEMAAADYGNWRVLHLPASAAQTQALSSASMRLAPPPAAIRALALEQTSTPGETREAITPSRIVGTRMSVLRGGAGACRWTLDQLEGWKTPATAAVVGSAAAAQVRIVLDDWPAVDGAATPLPVALDFSADNGSVGDIRIAAGTPSNLAYGIEVTARIDDADDVRGVAALLVTLDYRFSGLAQGNPEARIALRLLGDGRYERINSWVAQPAGAAVAA